MKLFLTLLLFSQVALSQEIIKEKYPFFRMFRAGFNITFGIASMVKGDEAIKDDSATNAETNIGYALMGIGLLRLGDGGYFFINDSLVEKHLAAGKLDPTSKDYKKYLNEAVEFEKRLRTYRGAVILVNGLTFGLLYNEDNEKNEYALLPAVGMMFVGSYAIWAKGPAEKQLLKDKKNNLSFNVNYKRINSDLVPYAQLRYTF